MESKYNLLTRLLKNIKNVVTPDGNVAGSGGSGGMLVVHNTYDEATDSLAIDASFNDIHDAVEYGKVVMLVDDQSIVNVGFKSFFEYLTAIGHDATLQSRNYFVGFGGAQFFADSPDVLMDSDPEGSQAEYPPEAGGIK